MRYLAGATFSLYLFHRPMTHFLVHAGVNTGDNWLAFTGVVLGIIAACFALAAVTERRRDSARRFLTWLAGRLVPGRLPLTS